MKVTFDKEKMRPIIKQVMEAQLGSIAIPDAQIDQFLDSMGGGQAIPLNETADAQAGERRLEDLRAGRRQRRDRTEPLLRLLRVARNGPTRGRF